MWVPNCKTGCKFLQGQLFFLQVPSSVKGIIVFHTFVSFKVRRICNDYLVLTLRGKTLQNFTTDFLPWCSFRGYKKVPTSSKAANLFLTSFVVEISRSIKEPNSILASVGFGLVLIYYLGIQKSNLWLALLCAIMMQILNYIIGELIWVKAGGTIRCPWPLVCHGPPHLSPFALGEAHVWPTGPSLVHSSSSFLSWVRGIFNNSVLCLSVWLQGIFFLAHGRFFQTFCAPFNIFQLSLRNMSTRTMLSMTVQSP